MKIVQLLYVQPQLITLGADGTRLSAVASIIPMCVVAFFTAIGGGSSRHLNFAPKSARRHGVPLDSLASKSWMKTE